MSEGGPGLNCLDISYPREFGGVVGGTELSHCFDTLGLGGFVSINCVTGPALIVMHLLHSYGRTVLPHCGLAFQLAARRSDVIAAPRVTIIRPRRPFRKLKTDRP